MNLKTHKVGKINKELKSAKEYDILYVYRTINMLNLLPGLQKITYTKKDATTVGYIVKIYSLVMSFCLSVNAYFLIRDVYHRNILIIVSVIDTLSLICARISAIISTLLAAFVISPYMLRGLKLFRSVDEKLGIYRKSNYIYLRSRIMIIQGISITGCICHYFYEIHVGVALWSDSLRAFTMHLTDFFTFCQSLDFTVVIWIIVTRMKVFNSQLKNLIIDNKERDNLQNIDDEPISSKLHIETVRENQLQNTKYDEKNRTDNLIRLMKIFNEIADITDIVSSSFGLSILFSSTMTFLYQIATVNGLIMFDVLYKEDSSHTVPYVISWCTPATIYLLISAYFSEKLKNEVEHTNASIDKLSIDSHHDTKECELIEDFSQLLSVREVFITAANFFTYDMTFILSMVGGVASYTVLLMQVKMGKVTEVSNFTIFESTLENFTSINQTN